VRTARKHISSALAAGLALAALVSPPARGAGTPVTQAQIAPVLAQMRALQISSERFAVDVTLHGRHLPKPLSKLRSLSIGLSGEANLTRPESGIVATKLLGRTFTARVTGNTIYTYEPKLGAKDGGRPWIKDTEKIEPDLTSTTPGVAPAGTPAPFAKFASLLAAAKSVSDLGPVTANGLAATRYRFVVPPSALDAKISKKLKAKLKRLHIKESATIDADVAADGLPAHTEGVLSLGRLHVSFTTDLLAVNFPLVVAPPPPEETITVRELTALLAKEVEKHKHRS
jgi:hypothetical protein